MVRMRPTQPAISMSAQVTLLLHDEHVVKPDIRGIQSRLHLQQPNRMTSAQDVRDGSTPSKRRPSLLACCSQLKHCRPVAPTKPPLLAAPNVQQTDTTAAVALSVSHGGNIASRPVQRGSTLVVEGIQAARILQLLLRHTRGSSLRRVVRRNGSRMALVLLIVLRSGGEP